MIGRRGAHLLGGLRATIVVLTLALGLPGRAAPAGVGDAGPVVIELQSELDDAPELVTVDNLAAVTGGAPELRRSIRALDITVLSEARPCEEVTDRQVRVRLLLAGYSPNDFTLTGSRTVRLSRAGSVSRADVHAGHPGDAVPFPASPLDRAVWESPAESGESQRGAPVVPTSALSSAPPENSSPYSDWIEQIRTALAGAWESREDDVEVELIGAATLPPFGPAWSLQLPVRPHPGRLLVRLQQVADGRTARVLSVSVQARLRQPVIVAAAEIPRGMVLSESHLKIDRRFAAARLDEPRLEDLVGRAARRTLPEGTTLRPTDLTRPPPPAPEPLAIKARDQVRLVARKRGLRVVVPAAEALQAGRIGELIRVRNLQSNAVVVARIISEREVELDLN